MTADSMSGATPLLSHPISSQPITVPFPLPLGAIPLSTPRQERDSSLLNTALLPAEALSSWLLSKSSMSP